jgi:hypothetical protein
MQPLVTKQFQFDEDDSSIVTLKQAKQKPGKQENLDDEQTLNSESRISTTVATSKKTNSVKNFGITDYVEMFDEKEKEKATVRKKVDYDSPTENTEKSSPKKQARVKIEYSSSSSASSDESSAREDRRKKDASFNHANEKNEESDDDFKW